MVYSISKSSQCAFKDAIPFSEALEKTIYSIKKSNQFKGEQKSFENAIPFSEALEKTKFGKLNYFIIILSGIVMANVVLETASVAYFMPVANCDLNLTNSRKGILSAISYVGIIISAHLWGFLADTQGRKRIIMPTLLLGFVATLFSSFATNFWIMLILRFVNGIFISGSSATIYAYLGEFHIDRTRSRAIMISAFIFALGAMLLPFLSFLVINQDWRLPLPFLNITYKPWRLFVIVCGLPGCIAGLLLFFLPESPKFLLSIQKEDEAIEVLKKMYKMNGGKDELKEKTSKKYARKESTSRAYKNKTRAKISKPSGGFSLLMVYFHFPLEWYGMFAMARNLLHSITHLLPEEDSNDISLIKDTNLNLFSKLFLTMWNQTVPLFRRKYIRSTAIVCVTQFWFHFITNGLYMWFPYIINAMSEFMNNNPGQNQLLCQIVYAKHANQTEGIMDCPDKLENATYLYSLIMEILYALSFVLIGLIVNYVGKKSILFTGTIFCSSCGLVAVWLPHTYTAAIFYVLLFLVGVCISVLGGATVELYPTQLRAMAMCISLMIGRIGSVVGTNIVGGFLATYCETTFYIACFSMMSCAIIIVFLPRSIHESSILKKSIDQGS